MTGKTHFAGGVLTGLFLSEFAPEPMEKAVVIGVSAAAGILPDIDIKGSTINKKLKLTNLVAHFSKHRGFFHAPLLYVVLGAVLLFFVPPLWAAAFTAGALSHLLLDSLNPTGVMLFYPFSKKFYHFAKIKTGGGGDMAVNAVLIFTAAFLVAKSEVAPVITEYLSRFIPL